MPDNARALIDCHMEQYDLIRTPIQHTDVRMIQWSESNLYKIETIWCKLLFVFKFSGGFVMQSEFREIINPSMIHDPVDFTHVVIPKGKRIAFLSGQLAWDKDFQIVGVNDLAKQTDRIYQNIQHALDEIGATRDHVVKTTVFTTRPHDYETIGASTAEFFGDTPPPAQTLIGVTGLALPEFLIEIEATVVL